MVNELLRKMLEGEPHDETGAYLAALAMYAVNHFRTEEDCMKKYKYDGYSAQRAAHTQFIEIFLALEKEFESSGVTPAFVTKTRRLLSQWLQDHIESEDKKLGKYLNSQSGMMAVCLIP